MFPKEIILITIIPSIWSTYNYLKSVQQGNTKPNLVSWGMWSVFPIISVISALYSGFDIFETFTTFTAGLIPFVIFVGTILLKKANFRFTKLDVGCLVMSVVGLGLWITSGNPLFALIFSTFADFVAAIPTLIKTFKNPHEETIYPYLNGAVANIILFLTLTKFNLFTLVFPVYLFCFNLTICIILTNYYLKTKSKNSP